MQKITPFLWYAKEAEEAAKFYTSIFPNSRVVRVTCDAERITERPAGVGQGRRVCSVRTGLHSDDRRPDGSV